MGNVRKRQWFHSEMSMRKSGYYAGHETKYIPWAGDHTLCLKRAAPSYNWQIYMGDCSSGTDNWAEWNFPMNPPERVSLHDDEHFPGIGKWKSTERIMSTASEKGLAIGANSARTFYTDNYEDKHWKFERIPVHDGGFMWDTVSDQSIVQRRIPGGAQNQDLAISITSQCVVNVARHSPGFSDAGALGGIRMDENNFPMMGVLNSAQDVITWNTYPNLTYWKKTATCADSDGCTQPQDTQ